MTLDSTTTTTTTSSSSSTSSEESTSDELGQIVELPNIEGEFDSDESLIWADSEEGWLYPPPATAEEDFCAYFSDPISFEAFFS